MTAEPSRYQPEDIRNVILQSADMPLGRKVVLKAGQRLKTGDTVWFPVSALVRTEVGCSGVIAGWANGTAAVGLVECLHSIEEADPWIVAIGGTAVAVQAIDVQNMIGRSPTFSIAAMLGLHNMARDARRIAASHVEDKAAVKIAKLLLQLDLATPEDQHIAVKQAEIARWLGLQRTTVSTVMKDMKRKKLIKHVRTTVTIPDRHALIESLA